MHQNYIIQIMCSIRLLLSLKVCCCVWRCNRQTVHRCYVIQVLCSTKPSVSLKMHQADTNRICDIPGSIPKGNQFTLIFQSYRRDIPQGDMLWIRGYRSCQQQLLEATGVIGLPRTPKIWDKAYIQLLNMPTLIYHLDVGILVNLGAWGWVF